MARNPDLDITFDCKGVDAEGNRDQGVIKVVASLAGSNLNVTVFDTKIVVEASLAGTGQVGLLATDTVIEVIASLDHSYALAEPFEKNWIAWSRIGSAVFTIGRDNIAGKRPMDWKGWVYDIRILGGNPVVYGENGVTVVPPIENTFGIQTIHRIGLESKQAVTGNKAVHFFIDNKGYMYRLDSEGKERLDYSEYLSPMSGIVMSYDIENNLVYICDGTYGFVYSPGSKSLGSGPVNVTGIGSQDGTQYIVSPAAIVTPNFAIRTDIWDFGTRNGKSIHSVRLATDVDGDLSVSIEYRQNRALAMQQTDWKAVDGRGDVFFTIFGYEFRFRARLATWEYFEADEFIVDITVHDH